jgi:uncharacterized protein (TIGR03435 family)
MHQVLALRPQLRLDFRRSLLQAAPATPFLVGVLIAPAQCAQLQPATLPGVPDWQTAAGGKMAFEVASVRLIKTPRFQGGPAYPLNNSDAYVPGNRFHFTWQLWVFVQFAYKLGPNPEQQRIFQEQIPKGLWSEQFEIDARAPRNPSKDQMRLMVQSLLAERFKLAVHFEGREIQVLAATLVKPGKTGPKLIPHSDGPPCPDSFTMPNLRRLGAGLRLSGQVPRPCFRRIAERRQAEQDPVTSLFRRPEISPCSPWPKRSPAQGPVRLISQ